MSKIIAHFMHGPHPHDRREVEVPLEAQQWFSAKLGAALPAATNNRSFQNLLPLIMQTAGSFLGELVEKAGGKEAAIAIVQKAYMDYIAPIDMPNVPNLIEPMVDNFLAYVIGVLLSPVIDIVLPPTVPTPAPTPAVGSSAS